MALVEQIQIWAGRPFTVLLFSLLLVKLLTNKYGRGLHTIPGPFLASFTNLWRMFNTAFSNSTVNLIHLHEKLNSSFVRLGPNVVSISDPDLIERIYGLNSGFTKTAFYSIIDQWYKGKFTHSLFESRDEKYHTQIRRPIASAYSMSTMLTFESAVDSTMELLMFKWDRLATSGEPFKLEVWLQRFTFDAL